VALGSAASLFTRWGDILKLNANLKKKE